MKPRHSVPELTMYDLSAHRRCDSATVSLFEGYRDVNEIRERDQWRGTGSVNRGHPEWKTGSNEAGLCGKHDHASRSSRGRVLSAGNGGFNAGGLRRGRRWQMRPRWPGWPDRLQHPGYPSAHGSCGWSWRYTVRRERVSPGGRRGKVRSRD